MVALTRIRSNATRLRYIRQVILLILKRSNLYQDWRDCYHIAMFAPGPALLELSAQRQLQQLNTEFGAPAAAVAAVVPALSAQLDQHAAAVRDILVLGVDDSARVPMTILLAGYVRGLLDHFAERADGFFAGAPADWHDADWLQLRLAAVCAYAAD